jgi:hypothetical protein
MLDESLEILTAAWTGGTCASPEHQSSSELEDLHPWALKLEPAKNELVWVRPFGAVTRIVLAPAVRILSTSPRSSSRRRTVAAPGCMNFSTGTSSEVGRFLHLTRIEYL